ncbi:MAG TPA: outer membrane lipoprotein-sorting protein, partial [Isosphaeraceae bacterium]|nr:outer membrane lipoprotein-sorting protein [Isosphaeraceae bacterium]
FSREDFDSKWQEKTFFQGRAILKSPDLAFLDFQKVVGKEMKLVPYEQIRCTGKEVYQYLNERKQIYIYPLAKQERQRALEEGPLPFLFNMKADEANARYLMNLISENIQYYVITIQPRKAIDKSAFIRADVVLDRATFLPAGLKLYLPPDGKDVQTYRFTGDGHFIKPNVEVNEQNFQGKVLNGWDIVRDPGPSAPAPAPVDPQPVNQRRPAIGKAVQGGYPQRR